MSYNARRINKPRLRRGLLHHKNRFDKLHAQGSAPDSAFDTPAGENPVVLPIPDTGARRLASDNRMVDPIRRMVDPIRPAIRDIIFPESRRIAPEENWGRATETSAAVAKSSAPFWGTLLVLLIVLVWGAGFLIGFQASLVILLSVGLVLCVAGLVSPSLGLLAIGMVAALDAMANIFLFTGGILRYNTLNYWLLIVILLYLPFVLRLRDLNSRSLQIFLLLMLLELAFSQDRNEGIQDILNIGVTLGMVVYFARALDDELSFYWLGIVNGVLAGLGGLLFLLQIEKLPYANPNDWTYFQLTALFSICIAFPFAVKYQRSRLILLLLAAVNFAWIFLSGSRGSLLVGILSLTYLFLATRNLSWRLVMIVIAVMIALWISLNFTEQQSTTISRIQLLFDTSQSSARRTSERSLIARAGWEIFQKNPMGIGTGSFAQASITTGLVGSQRPAHSAWIQVLAENGVLGVLLLAAFIGSYAVIGFRKHNESKLLFGLFITIVFASAFVAKEFRGKSLWFLAASGIVLLHAESMLAYLQRKIKPNQDNDLKQLRKVRFGGK